jgi:DNA-binding response OmpR family regulator
MYGLHFNMNAISKNIIFYITIIESNVEDHSFLRKAIHAVVPTAMVESVYTDQEAVHYFNNCTTIPHLIFLDQDMLHISGRDTMELIRRINLLDQVPVIFLTNAKNKSRRKDFIKQGASNFYSKPYAAQDLLNIVGAVNSKWLA